MGWNGSYLAEAVTCCLFRVERKALTWVLPCGGSDVLSVSAAFVLASFTLPPTPVSLDSSTPANYRDFIYRCKQTLIITADSR